jgi:uncharacterized protein with GYD domain
MSKHVVLVNWTEQGIQQAGETIQRAASVARMAEDLGGHMELIVWTLGRFDLVAIADLPLDEAVATLGL